MIIIQTPEDMKKYYDKDTNTYRFVDGNGNREDVTIQCDIKVNSNIYARNIYARDVNARNIYAWDVNAKDANAWDVNAKDVNALNIDARNVDARNVDAWNVNALNIDALNILYYAVCIAYETFKCKSVKGRRENSVHMCLDGEIEYKVGDEQ